MTRLSLIAIFILKESIMQFKIQGKKDDNIEQHFNNLCGSHRQRILTT